MQLLSVWCEFTQSTSAGGDGHVSAVVRHRTGGGMIISLINSHEHSWK